MKNLNITKQLIGTVIFLIMVLGALWLVLRPKAVVFQGRIEAKEVYLSAKIPSRLKTIAVEEGQSVSKGQLLATLESPELDARESQALAAAEAAEAMKTKALNGARWEEIHSAKNIVEKAQAASKVMQKTYQRIENLYKDGLVSEQERDEVFAKKEAALRDERVAHSQYLIATAAVRKEDLAAAKANEERAKGALEEVKVFKSEREIYANIDAEVLDILPEQGELISAGFPVVHLVDLRSAYIILNVKETQLNHFRKGDTFEATVPALDNKKVQFKILLCGRPRRFCHVERYKNHGRVRYQNF